MKFGVEFGFKGVPVRAPFFLGGHLVLVNGGFKSEVQPHVQSEVGTSLITT